jgi:hypothetical protein
MAEQPDEIDRLDDGALAGRLDFDDWIRELPLYRREPCLPDRRMP